MNLEIVFTRYHQVKMGSLAWTQSSMPGGLMKRKFGHETSMEGRQCDDAQTEDGQVTAVLQVQDQQCQVAPALELPGEHAADDASTSAFRIQEDTFLMF